MYRNILVPVEMSHKGRGTSMLEVAKRLADNGARITLLNIVEDVPSYVMVQLPKNVIDEAKAVAREELEAIAAEAGVEADVEVGRGRAHSAILAHAERTGSDLIIIASHDPVLQDYLLGSTAARVVRHAKCTVLVIR